MCLWQICAVFAYSQSVLPSNFTDRAHHKTSKATTYASSLQFAKEICIGAVKFYDGHTHTHILHCKSRKRLRRGGGGGGVAQTRLKQKPPIARTGRACVEYRASDIRNVDRCSAHNQNGTVAFKVMHFYSEGRVYIFNYGAGCIIHVVLAHSRR